MSLHTGANCITMKAVLFSAIFVFNAVGSVNGSSEVTESTDSYCCCESPKLEFNQSCEITWKINSKTIAYFEDEDWGCSSPCKTIKVGWITLDQCVDVNATELCPLTSGDVREQIIYLGSKQCSCPSSNKMAPGKGSVGLLLLAGLIVFVKLH